MGGDVDAVRDAEQRLRDAMLRGDVDALDGLIGDGLLFTGLGGRVFTKAEDLDAHRSRRLRLRRLDLGEPLLRPIVEGVVAVVVQAVLEGEYDGAGFAETFAYTRIWHRTPEGWQVEAGHVSAAG